MGLIKAITGAIGSVAADQWKEFFYCEALSSEVLVAMAQKKVSGRSSNTKGNTNIITNGSVVAVNEGQCMIIVDQGKIVEFSAEAGEFIYEASSEPSLFHGDLGDAIIETFAAVGKRFTFGGDAGKDQRVYFLNTKEILGNKYGTTSPVPFRVVDHNIGLDIDITIRCNGEFSYKMIDPLLFYTNVCGNVADTFQRETIDSQLRSELLTALQPAFAKISAMGVRYSEVPAHAIELTDALNEILSAKWSKLRGIAIVSFGMNQVRASDEDEAMIKELQKNAVYRNPNMAAATLVSAQADAMRAAASNEATGPMMAFAGMNMANVAGGMNANTLYQMGASEPQQSKTIQKDSGWTCACGGTSNVGKFCSECGAVKQEDGWICSCGAVNKGKFCSQCGGKKPAGALLYQCDKCGWEPENPASPPKFCPECGDPFDDSDVK